MKIDLKNKTIWFYFELIALVLTLVSILLYSILAGSDGILLIVVDIVLIVGLGAGVVKLFFKNTFVDLVPAICLAVALGLLIHDGLPIITDVFNKVNFNTGTLRGLSQEPAYYATRYYVYYAITAVAMILNTIALFFDVEKK